MRVQVDSAVAGCATAIAAAGPTTAARPAPAVRSLVQSELHKSLRASFVCKVRPINVPIAAAFPAVAPTAALTAATTAAITTASPTATASVAASIPAA